MTTMQGFSSHFIFQASQQLLRHVQYFCALQKYKKRFCVVRIQAVVYIRVQSPASGATPADLLAAHGSPSLPHMTVSAEVGSWTRTGDLPLSSQMPLLNFVTA